MPSTRAFMVTNLTRTGAHYTGEKTEALRGKQLAQGLPVHPWQG